MAWARGKDLPVIIFAESFETIGDLASFAPCQAVIVAPLIEAAHILQTKKKVNHTAAVRDRDRVVVSDFVRVDPFRPDDERVLFYRPRDAGDLLAGTPRFPSV